MEGGMFNEARNFINENNNEKIHRFLAQFDMLLSHHESHRISTTQLLKSFNDVKERFLKDVNFDFVLPSGLFVGGQQWFHAYEFDFEQKEYSSKNIIIDDSKRIQKIIYDVYKDNSNLLKVNGREFEEMIAELLYKQGYKVELTKRTRDGGYDIIALMDLKMHHPLKFLVECKQTKLKVGVDVIRKFKEVIDTEKANRGIIVTTSYFTRDALKKQQEIPYLLDYRDKDKVIEWVKEYFKSSQI
jgi:restriction endonuclease Mrr